VVGEWLAQVLAKIPRRLNRSATTLISCRSERMTSNNIANCSLNKTTESTEVHLPEV
jgi:hypothetical protein